MLGAVLAALGVVAVPAWSGLSSSILQPDEVGLVNPTTGEWHLRSSDGATVSFYYGNPGDVPFMGDWDCDGDATPGLFRLSDAYAYLRNSNSQGIADIRFFFGNPSDIPLAGDFNGDGCDTLSLYRADTQEFFIINHLGANEGGLGAADYSFVFGNPGDKPVVGDWDGDGITEVGLHRESTGFFYYRESLTTGIADGQMYFGDPGDRFVSGDWGVVDGADTPAVYRPSTETFYFRHTMSQGTADSEATWGDASWAPVAGRFGSLQAALSPCPESTASPITDRDVRAVPDTAEPAPRQPFIDPVFNTCVVRVTDRQADVAPGDASPGLKNEYSRVQSFNATGDRFLIRGTEASWYLYSTASLRPLGQLSVAGSIDPRWDATNANRLYFSDDTRLMAYDVASGEQSLVHDFAVDFPGQTLAAVGMRYEGSPSRDGRYWGMMAQDANWEPTALLVYDQQADQVIASRPLGNVPELDTVTISPLGNYFLAYFDYCESGLGTESQPCGLMVYDRNLTNGRGLLRTVGHSDAAIAADGREVLLFQEIDQDAIALLDLATGETSLLWSIDFTHSPTGLHFSGRAFERPGWALVSTYSGAHPSATWMDEQVFAVELRENGRVVRLAHTHSIVDQSQEHDYWAEPQASVNSNFSRILFTTNWGRSGTAEVETMMIMVPPGWLD